MVLEDVKQLKTVNGQPQAQELLDAGWTLLAVCVIQGEFNQHAEYHLGRAAEPSGFFDMEPSASSQCEIKS